MLILAENLKKCNMFCKFFENSSFNPIIHQKGGLSDEKLRLFDKFLPNGRFSCIFPCLKKEKTASILSAPFKKIPPNRTKRLGGIRIASVSDHVLDKAIIDARGQRESSLEIAAQAEIEACK